MEGLEYDSRSAMEVSTFMIHASNLLPDGSGDILYESAKRMIEQKSTHSYSSLIGQMQMLRLGCITWSAKASDKYVMPNETVGQALARYNCSNAPVAGF